MLFQIRYLNQHSDLKISSGEPPPDAAGRRRTPDGSAEQYISAAKIGRKKPFANRIRELRQLWRPLIGLPFTGRPAEPEPKRGRCSAGPAFSHGAIFERQAPQTKRDQTNSLLEEKNLR